MIEMGDEAKPIEMIASKAKVTEKLELQELTEKEDLNSQTAAKTECVRTAVRLKTFCLGETTILK